MEERYVAPEIPRGLHVVPLFVVPTTAPAPLSCPEAKQLEVVGQAIAANEVTPETAWVVHVDPKLVEFKTTGSPPAWAAA